MRVQNHLAQLAGKQINQLCKNTDEAKALAVTVLMDLMNLSNQEELHLSVGPLKFSIIVEESDVGLDLKERDLQGDTTYVDKVTEGMQKFGMPVTFHEPPAPTVDFKQKYSALVAELRGALAELAAKI